MMARDLTIRNRKCPQYNGDAAPFCFRKRWIISRDLRNVKSGTGRHRALNGISNELFVSYTAKLPSQSALLVLESIERDAQQFDLFVDVGDEAEFHSFTARL